MKAIYKVIIEKIEAPKEKRNQNFVYGSVIKKIYLFGLLICIKKEYNVFN